MPAWLTRDFFDRGIRFFLYALTFWLPYSSAAVEVCIVLGFILWAIKKMVWQEPAPKPHRVVNGIHACMLAFLLVSVLSALNSILAADALQKTFTKTLEWFVIYWLVVDTFKEKRHFYTFFFVWGFTALAVAIDSVVQYYFTFKDIFRGQEIVPGDRARAAFKTPNGLGAYLIVIVPVAFFALLQKPDRLYKNALSFFLLGLFIWSLWLSSSRGAWMGLAAAILAIILFFTWRARSLRAQIAGGGSLVIMGLTGFWGFTQYFLTPERAHTVSWRLGIWQEAMKMITDRFFLGHGINSFMTIFQEYRLQIPINKIFEPTYAHNCFLQLTAETGVIGLSIFSSILFYFFRYVFSLWKNGEIKNFLALCQAGMIFGIIGFLAHSFFDINWYSLQLGVYLWLSIGVAVALTKFLFIVPPVKTQMQINQERFDV